MSKKANVLNDKSLRRVAITFLFWAEHDYNVLATFLGSLKVPCLVSPLHDKDINEINADTGEIEYKKPHYHVIVEVGTTKTVLQWYRYLEPIRDFISLAAFDKHDFSIFSSVDEIRSCDWANKILYVWEEENSIKNMRGLIRYFRHLDNPEKAQYGNDYHCFGGFDIDSVLLNQSDMLVMSFQILDFINNNDCYNFADLIDYARFNNIDWCQVLLKNNFSNYIISYMKSALYRNTGAYENKIKKYENSSNNS